MSQPTKEYEDGMKTRRSVLGDKHVDAANASMTPFDSDFQSYITENVWGSLWSRQTISNRERSMITLALLAALGRDDEVALHVRSIKNTGATANDVKEAFLHVAVYAGVPAANHAFGIAKKIFAEMQMQTKTLPKNGE